LVYLTRREKFSAAHRLYNPEWTDEMNEEMFGRCANHAFHGHNFQLFVTVKGEPDPGTGFVINAKHLGRIIKENIIEKVDHMNLNSQVDFLKGIMPSTENIAKAIWNELDGKIPAGKLHCVKLTETENIFVEYYGD